MNISPTDLRISTHTATCNINTHVNLQVVSKYLEINEQIKYVEYGDTIKKGENKKVQSKKAKAKKRVFFNQITIIIEPTKGRLNNVKLFNNGAVSMTGLKQLDEGEKSINILLTNIRDIEGISYYNLSNLELEKLKTTHSNGIECKFCNKTLSHNNIKRTHCNHYICNICNESEHKECKVCNTKLVETGLYFPNLCKVKNYKIVLINSDYYLGFEIKRDILHELLVNKYNIFSSYEPCIYPGVNSKYYFNYEYSDKPYIGKCYCNVYCDGKGNGNGIGECKKITVAIFQSGSIIITGARDMEQIKHAHKFINGVINDNYNSIKKDDVSFLNIPEKKKIIKLKKENIINYPSTERIDAFNLHN
jgi:TATA-box binding protein (TBP) (component of TFIID and TFIIIB)